MKFTHLLRYVDDVDAALTFYEAAFGLKRHFLHEGGDYGELDTGDCKLSFAANSLIESHGVRFRKRGDAPDADATEIGLESGDIQASYDRALAAGATAVMAPKAMPWGQKIAYLADPWGHLIGLGEWG